MFNCTCTDCGKKFRTFDPSWWCDECRKKRFEKHNEKKKPTNADRIRAMSDEELAELFGAILREREIIILQKLREQGVEASIVEMPELTFNAHLEWLKLPAEE